MSFCVIKWNQNMEKRAKLSDMDTDSFIAYIKTEDIYSDIAKDVWIRFETSNYELDRPLRKEWLN